MAQVIWSPAALDHLEPIRACIEQFDLEAAQRIALRPFEAGESLRHSPDQGRSAGNGKRELPTVRPYVMRYEVRGDRAFILAIKHGSQLR